MKNQSGKTPLELLLTIVIVLLVIGVSIAMIFGRTDVASDIKEFFQKDNSTEDEIIIDETNQDENVQDESIQTEENKE